MTPEILASIISERAKIIARQFASGRLTGIGKVRAERRLQEALELIRPRWRPSVVKTEILNALDRAHRHQAEGHWLEPHAIEEACRAIVRACRDPYAPLALHDVEPKPETVGACLRVWCRPVGHPSSADRRGSRAAALGALFAELGLGGTTPKAIKKLLERRAQRKRARVK